MLKYLLYIAGMLGVVIVSAGLLTMVGTVTDSENITSIPSNTFTEFSAQLDEYTILDIRTPAEFAAGHLDGAQNIDFYSTTFQQELQKLDRDKTYVVYCRSGSRSKHAIQMMENLGFTSIVELDNGIIQCC